MFIKIILIIFLQLYFSECSCVIDKNHCSKCNPISKLCIKCDKDIYAPDENGGCGYSHKCELGLNYCIQCETNQKICQKCVDGYYPDENGGCSCADNCEISYRGECLKCKEDYVLIGDDSLYGESHIKICKSLFSGDLKNCKDIDKSRGICTSCKEGFFLNIGDNNCIKTDNCYESIFETCTKCNFGFYLDKKESECKNQTGIFEHCKQTINGKTCDICEDNYYLDEKGNCININFCLEKKDQNRCAKCQSGYYLSEYGTSCTTTEHCNTGDKDIGICSICNIEYYLDFKDGKCKSNQENNNFKNCRMADNDICLQCNFEYEIDQSNKCANTKFCADSNNGICIECIDNYYLGLDNRCSDVKHCIYSDYYSSCKECEDNYYYDIKDKKCKKAEGIFENCKSGYSTYSCENCKNDYYLNHTDSLCYSNQEEGPFYKCAKTDFNTERCNICEDGYYLGSQDNKCSKIEGCALSENENKCLLCEQYYCLDAKNGSCIINDEIFNEDEKFYYRCNLTNEEGTKCEICDDGFILNEKGLCFDKAHCKEKDEDGKCKLCQNDYENGFFCLNKDFGCVDLYFEQKCLECNDNLDLYTCTKCFEGYFLDDFGMCEKNE